MKRADLVFRLYGANPTRARHYWTFNLESGELRNSTACRISTYTTRLLAREGQPTLVQADLPIY